MNQTWAPGDISDGMYWYNKEANAFYVTLGAGPSFLNGQVFLKSDTWRIIERWIEYAGVRNYYQLVAPHVGGNYGTVEDSSVSPVGSQYPVWARDEGSDLVYIFGGSVGKSMAFFLC